MTDEATPAAQGATETIYVIEATEHTRDQDNYDVEKQEFLVDEGWFADEASAQVRVAQLEQRNRSYYNVQMDRERREHDKKITAAKQHNAEAAAIRAAGMKKADVSVPRPFKPTPYEEFVRPSKGRVSTSYEAVAVARSDHDGIAEAISVAEVVAGAATPEVAGGGQG